MIPIIENTPEEMDFVVSLDNSSYDLVYEKKILFGILQKSYIELLLLFASNYPINITST